MRLLIPALWAAAGCAAPGGNASPARAPEVEISRLDGTPMPGSALWKDRPTLLVFMTSWCGTCRQEVPHLNRVARRHAVAAVATGDRPEAVEKFRRSTGAAYPFYLDDGRAARAFNVSGTPTFVLVEPDGRIAYQGTDLPKGLE